MSLLFTVIVTLFIDLHLSPVLTFFQLNFIHIFIVTYITFSSSSLQFKVIVISFLLHRHCHLYRLFIYLHLLSFTSIVFAHVACHLQSSYYSSLSVSRTSKEHGSQTRHRPSSESKEPGARQGTDYISSGKRTESQTRHKSSSASQEFESRQDTAQLISSLNALVRSAGFSLKMQLRLLLLPISSHGSTAATASSWVHLILSSNLSRKF